jgi:hypothetical protein
MQIRFSYETQYGIFSDALNLSDDHSFSDEEIEIMKEQRRDNWVSYIVSTQVEVVEAEAVVEEAAVEQTGIVVSSDEQTI